MCRYKCKAYIQNVGTILNFYSSLNFWINSKIYFTYIKSIYIYNLELYVEKYTCKNIHYNIIKIISEYDNKLKLYLGYLIIIIMHILG